MPLKTSTRVTCSMRSITERLNTTPRSAFLCGICHITTSPTTPSASGSFQQPAGTSTSARPSQPPPLLLSQPSGNKGPAADLLGGPPPDGPPNDGPPSDEEPLDYVPSDRERSPPHPASPKAEQPNLAEAIVLMTQELKRCDHKKKSSKAKEPDTFDGSDPRKLNSFILQCKLFFADNNNYSDNHAKVTFALSYL